MKDFLKRYSVAVAIVGSLFLFYSAISHGYRSYTHFSWQHFSTQDGTVYVIPSWKK